MPTADYSPWANLKRRIEQAVGLSLRNNHAGMVHVYLELYVNADGTLMGWEEPDCKRLEPSRVNWCDVLRGSGGTGSPG
jgi:hypothetical protein